MDKINDIEMEFLFKKRNHSPGTDRLRTERNRFLKRIEYELSEKSETTKGYRSTENCR